MTVSYAKKVDCGLCQCYFKMSIRKLSGANSDRHLPSLLFDFVKWIPSRSEYSQTTWFSFLYTLGEDLALVEVRESVRLFGASLIIRCPWEFLRIHSWHSTACELSLGLPHTNGMTWRCHLSGILRVPCNIFSQQTWLTMLMPVTLDYGLIKTNYCARVKIKHGGTLSHLYFGTLHP